MDYEKKYKEALGWMQSVYPTMTGSVKEDAEHYFPELRESEDEKIRKELLNAFRESEDSLYMVLTPHRRESFIAWLEKQGEQKSIDYNEELKKCRKNPLYFFDKYVKLEERKSADKVESKFHEGDWVANDYCVGKVIALTDDAYLLDSGQGIPFSCEHNAHLWTIKDAKPGDVLCCESGWTCIFKTLNSDNISFSSYCFMDNTGWFCETGSESHTLEKAFIKAYNGNIYPATKEQRDLLFQKMHEASFVWDAEKKELKKIEEKPTEWSEEDEQNFNAVLSYINDESLRRWLKDAIYKKYDKPVKWSNEDHERYISCLKRLGTGNPQQPETINSKWFKEHCRPYSKQEWSEEDEGFLNLLLAIFKVEHPNGIFSTGNITVFNEDSVTSNRIIDWLKSLKERYFWKPSNEQMKFLQHYADQNNYDGTVLTSLLNDLKKL